MDKYFIMVNGQQMGPFTMQEIKERGFSTESYVYSKSLGDWKKLSEVPSFHRVEIEQPPIYSPEPKAEQYSVPQSNQGPGQSNYVNPGRPPKTWLVESILVTLFCCLPFGIAGIVNAAKVESRFAIGDSAGAIRASEEAAKWTRISFWIGIVIGGLYFLAALAGAY